MFQELFNFSFARPGARLAAAGLAALLFAAAPAKAAPECLQAVFFDLGNTLVDQTVPAPYPLLSSAQPAIDALQAMDVQVGIITNVPAGWDRDDLEALLAQPAFLDEFDVLILSSQAPAMKPDPAIYTFAHAALPTALPIAATAFVGETLTEIANSAVNPTSGARSVGMTGIHVSNAAPSALTDYTIPTNSLSQVATIVASTCMDFLDGFENGDTESWSIVLP
jgi:FMN phosphatase YigB (HAD superfamily)